MSFRGRDAVEGFMKPLIAVKSNLTSKEIVQPEEVLVAERS